MIRTHTFLHHLLSLVILFTSSRTQSPLSCLIDCSHKSNQFEGKTTITLICTQPYMQQKGLWHIQYILAVYWNIIPCIACIVGGAKTNCFLLYWANCSCLCQGFVFIHPYKLKGYVVSFVAVTFTFQCVDGKDKIVIASKYNTYRKHIKQCIFVKGVQEVQWWKIVIEDAHLIA